MWPSLFSGFFGRIHERVEGIFKNNTFVAPIFTFLIILTAVGVSKPEFDGGGDTAYALIQMIGSIGPAAIGIVSIMILAGSLSMMDSMLSSWAIVFCNDVVTPLYKEISPQSQVRVAELLLL